MSQSDWTGTVNTSTIRTSVRQCCDHSPELLRIRTTATEVYDPRDSTHMRNRSLLYTSQIVFKACLSNLPALFLGRESTMTTSLGTNSEGTCSLQKSRRLSSNPFELPLRGTTKALTASPRI